MNVSLSISTDIALKNLDELMRAAGPRGNVALARALNRTGAPTATATKRVLRKTLGLHSHPYAKYPLGDALKKRTSIRKATASRLEFSLAGFGKGLPLIYYKPREGRAGATVNWLGQRKMVPRSFYLSGKFPKRKRSGISGWVSERRKTGRWKLYRPVGPGVPEGMTTSTVSATWEAQATARLPTHLRNALLAVLRGY